MQLTTFAITTFLPLLAFTSPTSVTNTAGPTLPPTLTKRTPDGTLEKRSVEATVVADGVRHRVCPRTSCSAPGQYARGTVIRLDCYTRDNTTPVNGDRGWAHIPSNDDWIALSNGDYVSWKSPLPSC